MCALKCLKLQTPLRCNWRSILTWNVHYRSCVFIVKEIWASSSVSIVKSSPKDYLLNVFKLLETYFFFLALEAITIAVVNCKTSFMWESSVMCNALWKQFKMTVLISFISRVITKELLYLLRIWVVYRLNISG